MAVELGHAFSLGGVGVLAGCGDGHCKVNKGLTVMVRQLQPTVQGLPLE